MSRAIQKIAICGQGASVWLAACVVARFAVANPAQITVIPEGAGSGAQMWIARPDMARLHHGLGLDLKRVGGVSVANWQGPRGIVIPFLAYGAPLNGTAFHHIWKRGAAKLPLKAYNPALAKARMPGPAIKIDTQKYETALKKIATAAGVQTAASRNGANVDLWVETSKADGLQSWQKNRVGVGRAVFETPSLEGLELHILHTSLMALVTTLPDLSLSMIETAEYERKIAAIRPCLDDMEHLLAGDINSENLPERLAHRIDMWRACGRLVPHDDDPFQASEWIAALLSAGFEPQHYHRLADAIPMNQITAHLEAHIVSETVNV